MMKKQPNYRSVTGNQPPFQFNPVLSLGSDVGAGNSGKVQQSTRTGSRTNPHKLNKTQTQDSGEEEISAEISGLSGVSGSCWSEFGEHGQQIQSDPVLLSLSTSSES